jgi:hypothetical protein
LPLMWPLSSRLLFGAPTVGDKAELALLELGRRNFECADVAEGLEEHSLVSLYPSDWLTDGFTATDHTIE